ncbi:Probable dipeptide-transport integral membrane protein ABC transporter DppB [Mycobacteroides abscessus subsp. abscessus]|nr:Probable dipeptide-transport integral membrane protein ABC transporter DppB [Mycobacteroides abscessus subsp. abscessus]
MPTSDSVVDITGLTVDFEVDKQWVPAVKGVSLSVAKGEVLAIVGESGSGALLAGAVVTESVFNIPGLGRATFDAVRNQEGAVVVSILTLIVFFYIFFNLVVDILYALLDPRIRYE